jgi:hypothetical protein
MGLQHSAQNPHLQRLDTSGNPHCTYSVLTCIGPVKHHEISQPAWGHMLLTWPSCNGVHVRAQGKSVLIHTIVACLRTLGKTVETCAPTGIAASNIGGM